MSSKHQDPEWRKTVRLIRAQVKVRQARGEEVFCWRCGRELPMTAEGRYVFDVGHLDRMSDDNSPDNAAPEHTRCNRSHGGKVGAAITNRQKGTTKTFKAPKWA